MTASLDCAVTGGTSHLDSKLAENLSELDQAEKDLRFYAALIGRRPTMNGSPQVIAAPLDVPPVTQSSIPPMPEPSPMKLVIDTDALPSSPHKPHALRLWMRDLSHLARKRLDEAVHRLAS